MQNNPLTNQEKSETVGLTAIHRGLAPASSPSKYATRKGVFVFVGQMARVSRHREVSGRSPMEPLLTLGLYFCP